MVLGLYSYGDTTNPYKYLHENVANYQPAYSYNRSSETLDFHWSSFNYEIRLKNSPALYPQPSAKNFPGSFLGYTDVMTEIEIIEKTYRKRERMTVTEGLGSYRFYPDSVDMDSWHPNPNAVITSEQVTVYPARQTSVIGSYPLKVGSQMIEHSVKDGSEVHKIQLIIDVVEQDQELKMKDNNYYINPFEVAKTYIISISAIQLF